MPAKMAKSSRRPTQRNEEVLNEVSSQEMNSRSHSSHQQEPHGRANANSRNTSSSSSGSTSSSGNSSSRGVKRSGVRQPEVSAREAKRVRPVVRSSSNDSSATIRSQSDSPRPSPRRLRSQEPESEDEDEDEDDEEDEDEEDEEREPDRVIRVQTRFINVFSEIWTPHMEWSKACKQALLKTRNFDFLLDPTSNFYYSLAKRAHEAMIEMHLGHKEFVKGKNKEEIKRLKRSTELWKELEVPDWAEKEIRKIRRKGIQQSILRVSKHRERLDVTNLPMYLNSSERNMKPTKHVFFECVAANSLDSSLNMDRVNERIRKGARENGFACNCTGPCGKSCVCRKHNAAFRAKSVNDKNYRRAYSCGDECACSGKCGARIIPESEENFDVQAHHSTNKGFVVRSKIAFKDGEPVVEMKGLFQSTASTSSHDSYAIDIYDNSDDLRVGKWMLRSVSSKNGPNRWIKNHKKIMSQQYSLNPRNLSNTGRFISHSCFPTTRVQVVHESGMSPLNVRVLFRAATPILPNQEVTFNYGIPYVTQQLADVCLCGHLGCIQNRAIYKYLRPRHFIQFYFELYSALFMEYQKNCLEPIEKIKSRDPEVKEAKRRQMENDAKKKKKRQEFVKMAKKRNLELRNRTKTN